MKSDSLYQQTKRARRNQRVAVDLVSKFEAQKEKEMQEKLKGVKPMSTKHMNILTSLINKYARIIALAKKTQENTEEELINLGEEFQSYTRFNSFDIVRAMATFMTYIEGEEYLPAHSTEALQNSIIIKKSAIKDESELEPGINGVHPEISSDELTEAYYNGDAILLDNGYSNEVELYNNIGQLTYSIGNYTYLHEFFNRLILYRIENEMSGCQNGMDWIFEYMAEYLRMHPELAYMNKSKRDAMLSGEQDDFTKGAARLELLRRKEDE